jgi:hypothetical protein
MIWWTAFPVFGWSPSLTELLGFTAFISLYSAAIVWLCCLQVEKGFTWLNLWFIIAIAVHLIALAWPAGTVVVRVFG